LQDVPGSAGRWIVARRFWLRRARRLLPAAYLWAGLTCLFSLYFNRSGSFGAPVDAAVSAIAALFEFQNILLVLRLQHQISPGPLFHYWSLSFEEQFYVVAPMLILLRRRWLILAFFLISPILFRVADAYEGAFRIEDLVGGLLIARFETDIKRFWGKVPGTRHIRWGVPLLSVAVLVGLVALAGREWAWLMKGVAGLWLYSVGVALLSVLLVIVASADRGLLLGRGRLHRFSVWLGRRSYSIYLVHICAFLSARELAFRLVPPGGPPPSMVLTTAIGCVLLVAFSWATSRFVEVPTRSRRSVAPLVSEQAHAVTSLT
jgi:peptidoglycan/LPS O-acetylase OafA/YrhL